MNSEPDVTVTEYTNEVNERNVLQSPVFWKQLKDNGLYVMMESIAASWQNLEQSSCGTRPSPAGMVHGT